MKKEIGKVISACRKHHGLKQDYVAYRLQITTHSYANIEKGRVDINLSKLSQISKIFGLPAQNMIAIAEELEGHEDDRWIVNVVGRLTRIVSAIILGCNLELFETVSYLFELP